MKIHTVAEGECADTIAAKYGIDKKILCLTNEIDENDTLSVGEELLILTPTRTYTARDGDTMARIGFRFGQSQSELRALNPHIMKNEVNRGQTVVIKRDERPYGMGAANGIYYRDCPKWRLMRALPYTTYITVGSGVFDGRKCAESFDGEEIVQIAVENGKMPLIRVYDKSNGEVYKSRAGEYTDMLIELALKGGYKGIVLGYADFCRTDEYREFIVELRKKMIGSDLILISEIGVESPVAISDYSDGAILSIDKCGKKGMQAVSFAEYEGKALEEFANEGESTKTFLEIPAFAALERGGFVKIEDAIYSARKNGCATFTDKSSMMSAFNDKKSGSIFYNSLSGIKKRLDACADLGYMGISFDIARCPLSYLMMYDSLFKSIGYASIEEDITSAFRDDAKAIN